MAENLTNSNLIINDFFKMNKCEDTTVISKVCYSLCLVINGNGSFNMTKISYNICKGDIFMILPYHTCKITDEGDLEYISIEFTGSRGVDLAKGLLDYSKTHVFSGYETFIEMWENTLALFKKINNELLIEGLLLYTLGSIPGEGILKGEFKKRESIMLQSYIRNNFNNPDLSLETVAKVFGYNKKYLSDLFKKKFDISFTDFVKKVRLENAVSLMELGNSSVSKIATMCGFSDPLYFSKLFKVQYGLSPKKYMEKLE